MTLGHDDAGIRVLQLVAERMDGRRRTALTKVLVTIVKRMTAGEISPCTCTKIGHIGSTSGLEQLCVSGNCESLHIGNIHEPSTPSTHTGRVSPFTV